MKARVLLVAYYFPPLGLAGVGRPLNLFKYLPDFGYDCHVLTVKPVAYRKYEPELLNGLDQSKIFRAGSRDPQRLMYLLGIREVNPKTIARGLKVGESLFPDSKIGWVRAAVRLGKKLHEEHHYAAVISTSPPISTHLVGMQLAHECGIKWVADFRDLWAVKTAEETYTNEALLRRALALKQQIVETATGITAVNGSVLRYIGNGEVVANGYDPETASLWRAPESRDKFSIGLLGSFSDDNPLEPLFRAVRKLLDSRPDLQEKLELVQVGNLDAGWLKPQVTKYGLDGMIQTYGVQPRDRSAQILSQCAVMYAGLAAHLKGATTSRVFDLLASGRPLLIYAIPGGELARQVADSDALVFGDEADSAAVAFLMSHADRFFAGELEIISVPHHAKAHAWPRRAEQFARLLDRII